MKVHNLLIVLLPFSAMVWAQEDSSKPHRYMDSSREVSRTGLNDTVPEIREIPEEIKQRSDRGSAPFHIKFNSYLNYLRYAFDENIEQLLNEEELILNVSSTDLDYIYRDMLDFQYEIEQKISDSLTTECAPLIQGDRLTLEQARQIIERLDDSDGYRNAVANAVLGEIQNKSGESVAKKLMDRILDRGNGISHTKVKVIDYIQNVTGENFNSYLSAQCNFVR